jgi:hypothetical protein
VVGAGFSREAGLPATNEVVDTFLDCPQDSQLGLDVEQGIRHQLRLFWKYAFNHQGRDHAGPSLEDHFSD